MDFLDDCLSSGAVKHVGFSSHIEIDYLIEIIDEYHVKSLEWGLIFEVSEKISPNITHIGIRAHNFSAAEKDDVNAFSTENSTKLEMPFEWQITLPNGLWWKYDKAIYEHEFEIPKYLKVNPIDVILLEE